MPSAYLKKRNSFLLILLPFLSVVFGSMISVLDIGSAETDAYISLTDKDTRNFSQLGFAQLSSKNCDGMKFDAGNLSRCLTQNEMTDVEKAFAIYFWIANNISFDIKGAQSCLLISRICQNQSSEQVLRTRIAVGDGYARLFNDMAYFAGLNSRKINGFANYEMTPKTSGFANHSWNVVRINAVWYPLDVAWDAGSIDAEKGTFIRNDASFRYFMSHPVSFARQHLALDPKWRLNGDANVTALGRFFYRFSSVDLGVPINRWVGSVLFNLNSVIEMPPFSSIVFPLSVVDRDFSMLNALYFLNFSVVFYIVLLIPFGLVFLSVSALTIVGGRNKGTVASSLSCNWMRMGRTKGTQLTEWKCGHCREWAFVVGSNSPSKCKKPFT